MGAGRLILNNPRPEPDIEWPGLAADIDGRSIVARSYRHIANAILGDQSGADHGAWAPTARSSRAHEHATALRRHTVTTKQRRINRQPLIRHSFRRL